MSISFQQHQQVTVNINPTVMTANPQNAQILNKKTKNINETNFGQQSIANQNIHDNLRKNNNRIKEGLKGFKNINKENKQQKQNLISNLIKNDQQDQLRTNFNNQAILPKTMGQSNNANQFQDVVYNEEEMRYRQQLQSGQNAPQQNQNQLMGRKMNQVATIQFDNPAYLQYANQHLLQESQCDMPVKQKQAFNYQMHHQSDSQNTSNVMHQASMSHSFSIREQLFDGSTPERLRGGFRSDTLDSNGNLIRGRKIDSPQLVVVRELRDQEDLEENNNTGLLDKDILMQVFNSGNELMEGRYNLYNKQRDRTNSDQRRKAKQSSNVQLRQNKQQSKSVENHKKKSKSQAIQQNNKNPDKQIANIESLQEQRITKMKSMNLKNNATKSSREIRSSMGFHELLNQLDKDISLQQSNQFDFKNKTTHDLLKLELSGIRRQNSSGANIALQNNFFNKAQVKDQTIKQKKVANSQPKREGRSRSNERLKTKRPDAVIKGSNSVNQTGILPKSILKKSKAELPVNEHIFQYNVIEVTPDRNQNHQGVSSTSFLHSEHGRGVNSQVVQPSQQQLQNGVYQNMGQNQDNGLPLKNINVLFSKIKVQNKQSFRQNQSSQNPPQNAQSLSSKKQRDHSSQERQIKEFKQIGNIDKIVRENLRKIRSKEDEEKVLKLNDEENQRRKREQLDIKNNMVRKINKDKTYKKSLNQHPQFLNQNNGQQASSETINADKFQNFSQNKFWADQNKISQNIQQRDNFIQKQSQTQKIDFERIKQGSRKKNLKIKNHRKSYGLEFIDIKREIQEELRTIEQRYKNNLLSSKPVEEESQQFITDIQIPLQNASAKRLKIKQSKKPQVVNKNDTLPLNQGADQFISERVQPVNKVIVVKKNKIRKFMKEKQKLIVTQKNKEQQDEMLKAIKMQENIQKLNEFCKKKLEKQSFKKRITTLQVDNDKLENLKDISKISGRRIVFENVNLKKTINPKIDDRLNDTFEANDDSSRLSTEFYEEYYRLINSIKKEQQIRSKNSNHSKMDISSQNITQKSIKNLLSSPGNQSQSPNIQLSQTQQYIFSPKQQFRKEKSITKKSKSKSNLKHHEGVQLLDQNSQMEKSQLSLHIKKLKNQQQRSKDSQQVLKLQERAESAPLLMNQANQSNQKKSTVRRKSPTQKAQQKANQRQVNSQSQLKQSKRQVLVSKLNQLSDEETIQYIQDQISKIQNFYRIRLFHRGFYDQQLDSQMMQDFQQSAQETVVHNFKSLSQNNDYNTLKYDKSQESQKFNDEADFQDKQEYDPEDDFEDEDYDEENLRNDNNNLIIINQQSNDDKKVVYMSNINSCSLPQTPKIEDGVPLQQNRQMNQIHKVFEYHPENLMTQNKYLSLPESGQIHKSISQKPSIESHNSEQPNVINQKEQYRFQNIIDTELNSNINEDFKNDFQIKDEKESLMKDFKYNIPVNHGLLNPIEILSNQTSVRQIISNPSSVQSQLNQFNKQQKIQLGQDSKGSQVGEINSNSSQSLFERNSFQQFTQSKLQQMLKNNELMNLIEMRQKALDYRKTKEKKFIKKMYKNQQYSPRTYVSKKESLEKWVQLESEEIKKTKKQFEEEWQKTLKMIEDTQKDVDNMRKKMKIQIDNSSKNNLQFNSYSSRNSNSSYNTISKQEPRKSILELDEFQPMSQRSVRLSMSSSRGPNNQYDKYSIIKDQKFLEKSQISSKRVSPKNQQENLIDYLESSWIKSQQKSGQNQQDISNRPSLVQKNGIFIEDQNKNFSESQLSNNGPRQILDSIQDSDDVSQNLITERRDATISNIVHQFQNPSKADDERILTRSRSEQDLSDLLKKSKINFNDLDLINLEDGRKLKEVDSYRFDPRQPLNNDKEQIRIQENLFEDSSNRFSKGKNYYQDMNDLQSNDSLLNESELNNYFQDQKFSIEDFKSLDKRKILASNLQDFEDESILGRAESQLNIHQEESKNNDKVHNQIHSQLFQANESQIKINNEKEDAEPIYLDQSSQELKNQDSSINNDHDMYHQTAFMQHQQAFLFKNAKPGENIKIADILKKNQSMNEPSISNSFQLTNDSQLLFQNQQINQSLINPSLQPLIAPDYSQLADQITEEILQHILSLETVVNKRKEEHPVPQQLVHNQLIAEPATDIFIIDAQMNEKENRRETIEFRMRIVVEQDLIRVENYINEVIQSLQQAELQYLTMLAHNPSLISTQDTNYHRQFLQVLTTPIKRNEIDLLNMLQTSEIGSYEHFETAMDLNGNPILPIDLYLDIERLREESQIRMLYQNGIHDVDLESSVMQESTHIHNKSVFDALNESLMKFRPYGVQGEPMPWSNKNRRLQTKVDTNSVDTERLFFMVKQDVMRWAQTFSGCAPSPIFLFRRQIDDSEQFDDELFQETRERRLAAMLATEVVENEHQWLNYEFEEAQVKIDLSDMILEHLVEEAAIFLNKKFGIEISEIQ